MKKKWGLMWLVAIMITLLLAACSGDEDTSNSADEGTDSDDNDSSEESGEEITLQFVHWINEENGNWEPIIEMYEEENPGINIESVPLVENMDSRDYFKQLDLMASAGETIDLMMFSNSNDLVKRINAGLVAPIDEFMDAEGIDMNETYNNGYPPVDGQYYGLPMKSVTNGVMINKGHLEEAGLEIPTEWTWDDYREYAKAMTTEEHYGSYLHTWHNMFSSLKLLGKPENTLMLNEDGTSNADDPMLQASLELRYALEQEDKSSVPYSDILSQQMDYRQQIFTEEVSMIPIATYMITEWGQFTPDFEFAWAPWPKNEEDATAHSLIGGDLVSIGESSEHKQEAYDFMRWLTTEGISEQGIWVPSWKDADLDTVLEKLVSNTSNPDAMDLESLKHTITAVEPAKTFAPPSYITEVYTEFDAEVEMYLLGEQDIDTTMQNIQDKTQSIVESNQ
ncbi:ABC transporter substrate-binding protein [Saliterribacillus persicus]|uniref:Carbohydrate ABC transporter substrate-binding protein (CUT1 family) n=1 Tax=Saliterribacillus persicus TaxID=930114 RepID=A0A368Y3M8_9BACI|nr:extracellular solute-binding protein [Saliterribacillus persicus]RCW74883.1 carbohydrate ABC transporter substrate-binding protein (CUT1 family) [Saliterribacillus persicus]